MSEKLLEVGDKIQVDNKIFNKWISTIIRVTKTKAIGDIPTNKTVNMEFRRKYHDSDIKPFKSIKWRITSYTLLPKNDNNG